MTILEYYKKIAEEYGDEFEFCADIYDDVYDTSITVVMLADENKDADDYDRFCELLCSKVKIVMDEEELEENKSVYVARWSIFIENNLEHFRDFANRRWFKNNWKDDDDFVEEWIGQFHLYMSGYGNEYEYRELIKLLNNCKEED